MAVVAKWSNAPDCGSGIRGFETHQPPHGPLAQLVRADGS